jgi:hypothetical protein
MFGGVALVTLAVIVGFLLTHEEPLRCVEGELQDNATRPDGSVLPRVETFDNLRDAEEFICRRIPHPRDTQGFTLTTVRVARERNLGDTIEGEGGADIEFTYAWEGGGRGFEFSVWFPQELLPSGAGWQETRLDGKDALVREAAGITSLRWNRGGFSYAAQAELGNTFDLSALISVLESVR